MIDTLKMSETLVAAGIPEQHARAIATTQATVVSEGAATKADFADIKTAFAEFKHTIEARVGKVEADLYLLKWMCGTNLALTILLVGILLRK